MKLRATTTLLILAAVFALGAGAQEVARPVVFGTAKRFTPKAGGAQQLDDAAFDQDLAEIVAKAAGLPFRIAEFPTAPELLAALDRGDVDVIPSMARLPERLGKYLFSVRHTVSTSAVFMREGRKPPESETEVARLHLAAMQDSSGASFLRRKGWLDHALLLATTEEAMQAVASGRTEAAVSNQLVGLSVLRHLKLDDQIVPVFTLPGSSVDFCMTVRLDHGELLTRLNDGLLIASERGDLQRHREKWLPAFESYWASRANLRRWLLSGGAAALGLAVAGWLWYRFRLRAAQERAAEIARQVERRTQELAVAIEKLRASEDALRHLNAELELRVDERTGELARRVDEVEHLNGELEAFSYSVSHDLRAPLRNITGFLELLTRRAAGKLDAEGERFVATVTAEAKRLGILIDDLLAFSRIGRAELKTERVAPDELIAEARGALQAEIGPRRIDWKISALPPVLGDRALLLQVMANLLGNAVKFTRDRERAVIEIAAIRPVGGESMVTFSIRDNGAGFNPKYGEKLFGVFQRLHNRRDFEGTGIGLANVKRIVIRHGGRVWAEGQVDRGATFFFTLKLAAE
jgi:signal transduction histidine kinase